MVKWPYHEIVIRPNLRLIRLRGFSLTSFRRLSLCRRLLRLTYSPRLICVVPFNRNFSTALRRFRKRHIDEQNPVSKVAFA